MARPRSQRIPLLTYPLSENNGNHDSGYVHHWLTVGPYDQRLTAAPQPGEALDAFHARLLAEHARTEIDYVNVIELDRVRLGGDEHVWEVTHCAADHWLAWHGFLPVTTYRQAWGFVELHSARAQEVNIVGTVSCAARLWLHGETVLHLPADTRRAPQNEMVTRAVRVKLKAGANPLLLRLEHVGVRAVAMLAAVRVEAVRVEPLRANAAAISIQLPTVSRAPRRRQRLDAIYAQTRLDRAVYGKGDSIRLLAPARTRNAPVQLRLQKASGAIYAETIGTLDAGSVIESVRGSQLPNGALDAVVMAPFQQFYDEKLRARHTFPILIANQPFYTHPPAPDAAGHSADARLIELLRAQAQVAGSIYGELAKMAFGWWEQVDSKVIHSTMARVEAGEADVLPDLLGLVTIRTRMPAYQGFPHALLPELDRGLAAFMARDDAVAAWDGEDEANQLLVMAARHLLGQLYPGVGGKGMDGAALVAWLAARGRRGFHHWHSDHDQLTLALAPLVSLAQAEAVRESAAALLDLLAFALAVHSFGGTFGASRARVTPATLRSGRFAPEAALSRLLWGAGGYQSGVATSGLAAAVALGLAGKSYSLPDVVAAMARAAPATLWVQERHGAANLVSYKTPDYLMSSVQDYGAGRRGGGEHLWQATLGPEALVFANHPASYQQAAEAAPAWWVGNGTLPRVAQHHDALIARYALPADAWLHFTHAYFPRDAFDEHHVGEGWAFGRVGDGYVALWSAPQFTLVEHGPDAGRELRVMGRAAAWLCQMGRRALDGDFADFQRRVIASAPRYENEQVTWTTLRSDTLALGMAGPFLVNGQAVPLDNFPRHTSLFGHADFPADQFEMIYGADGLRLHF